MPDHLPVLLEQGDVDPVAAVESFENEFRFRRFLARPALDQCCQTLQLRLRVAQVHLNS